uniref:Uncharacterized protein n=1 Tax=viral metagenome TaxID=1070528 RepID=A0A6M3IXC0_9ZZZZ
MNDVSLRDYVDTRISSLEDKIDSLSRFTAQHFLLSEAAVKKAEESMLIRLEGMNEFRAQIREERVTYAAKVDLLNMEKLIYNRLKSLEEARAFSAGKMWVVMVGFAAIPTILALIALFIR